MRIPAKHLVGKEGGGFSLGQKWLGAGRIKQGARALGATRRCLELATAYAKQRTTFGQPLSNRQAIQWRLVDTYVALEAATLLVHRAAARQRPRRGRPQRSLLVKLYCTEMAWEAADMCLQVHGGIGLTTDLPVERLLARPAQPHDHGRHARDHAHGARAACAEYIRLITKEQTEMTDKKYENIPIEREGGITFLWLNRPEKRNAMSPELHFDMDDALDWLATDKQTQVLILGGKGEAWCAGQDLRLYFRGTQNDPEMRYKTNNASHSWRWERLSQFPKPTIAMVQGYRLWRRLHAALRLRFRRSRPRTRPSVSRK